MQCQVVYRAGLSIPAMLEHDSRKENSSPDIYGDYVSVEDGWLTLGSNCGVTRFPPTAWVRAETGGFEVPPGATAQFVGAWNSMNSVWGCRSESAEAVGPVKSSMGEFENVAEYVAAREWKSLSRSLEQYFLRWIPTEPPAFAGEKAGYAAKALLALAAVMKGHKGHLDALNGALERLGVAAEVYPDPPAALSSINAAPH